MIPEQYSLDKLEVDDEGNVRLILGDWEPCIFFGKGVLNFLLKEYTIEQVNEEVDANGFMIEVITRDQDDIDFLSDHPDFPKIYSEHRLEYVTAAKKLLVKSML